MPEATVTIVFTVDRDYLDGAPDEAVGRVLDEVVANICDTEGDAGTITVPGRGEVGRWEIT